MCENKILELFNKRFDDKPMPPESKYHNFVIKNMSKTVAEAIYSTNNSQSAFTIQKRQNLIEFIRLYTNEEPGHLQLNDSNYNIALNLISSNFNEAEIEELSIAAEEVEEKQSESFMENITDYYNKLDEKKKEQNEFLDLVAEHDQAKLKSFPVHKNIKIQHEPFEEFIKKFLRSNDDSNEKDNKANENCNTQNKLKHEQRILQVEYAYALLMLYESGNTKVPLEQTLQRLSCYKHLIQQEIMLLDYIFYSDINVEVKTMAFNYFKYLYEKPIIQFCTKLLHVKETEDTLNLIKESNDIQIILKVSQNNSEMKHKILELLYEMFALSDYNNNLLLLVNVFNKS